MTRLERRLNKLATISSVATTQTLGVPVLQVEAAAFAWLAHAFTSGQPGNLPAVTGAKGERILGAWYPK